MKPLRIILDFLSYEGTLTNNPQDAVAIKRKVEESNVSDVSRVQRSIAPATVDEAITLPDANSDYLLLFIDRQISIKLNGSSDALVLKPKSNGLKTPVFMMRGDITGLTISNAGTEAANIDLIAVNI
jgi:hypothetical protein